MAFSIEARVPYLDYRIVEFALGLDSEWKIRGSWTKWILRKVASRFMPAKVAWRRSKLGYPTPFGRWLRQPRERDALADVLFCRSHFERELVSESSLRFYWDQHQSGQATHLLERRQSFTCNFRAIPQIQFRQRRQTGQLLQALIREVIVVAQVQMCQAGRPAQML